MTEWPHSAAFADHSTWYPDWTRNRPRVLWYLTFEHAPGLAAAARPVAELLAGCAADVVPPQWLHLTVSDAGFADELDSFSLAASADAVRRAVRDLPALDLALGPVAALSDAVALGVAPVEPLRRVRELVRRSMAEVGVQPPDDLDGPFWPHVSLCYVNDLSHHDRLWDVVTSQAALPAQVRADRVSQVLVTRRDGHYEWEVLSEAPLLGSAHLAQVDPIR